ncbi:MAG: hypothetical protein E6Q50_07455 [Lysobacter sp.]|nr:MAG: hypothetical protein E6Q50_07455 [Lysobacter sp.]
MNVMSKAWPVAALALAALSAAALYPRDAETRVASETLALELQSGVYVESSRTSPSPDAELYWADAEAGVVRRCPAAGGAVETVIDSLGIPYGVAFDGETQELMWTDASGERVQKLALAGGEPRTLLASFDAPYAIDVSTDDELVYYAVDGPVVYLNRLNQATGEERSEPLLTLGDAETIHGLALDAERGVLYLGDANGRMTRGLHLKTLDVRAMATTETEMPPGQAPKGAVLAPISDATAAIAGSTTHDAR